MVGAVIAALPYPPGFPVVERVTSLLFPLLESLTNPLDLALSRDRLAELAGPAESKQRLYLSEGELAILHLIAEKKADLTPRHPFLKDQA